MWFIVLVIMIIIIYIGVKHILSGERDGTDQTNTIHEKRHICLSTNAKEAVEGFAALAYELRNSSGYSHSPNYDSMNFSLSWIEGRTTQANFALYTCTNLSRIAYSKKMSFSSGFRYSSDDEFLIYESNNINNADAWLGFQRVIQEIGKEAVLNDSSKLDKLIAHSFVSSIQREFPGIKVERASAAYCFDEKENAYRCSVSADFKI